MERPDIASGNAPLIEARIASAIAIVVHKAKTRAQREGRSVPFADFESDERAVEPDRFRGRRDTYTGHWRSSPADWGAAPDVISQDRETLRVAMRAIAALPPAQLTVIRMRDIEGSTAEEVCSALEISAGNQRVLLHRARLRVRAALEGHLVA